MIRIRDFLPVALLILGACAGQDTPSVSTFDNAQLSGESWHEADRLFVANPDTPQWKGADVANSIALGDNRVLWVFGDTLLAQPGANRCERFDEFNIQVHNSLAMQRGTDPTTARIEHFWAQRNGEPSAFFSPRQDDGSWYWMGGVTVLQDKVLIFLMHARSTVDPGSSSDRVSSCAGLDFEMLGWDARIATIAHTSPDQWQWRDVRLPADVNWHGILAGSSTVSEDGRHVYAWSAGPATLAGNPVFIARWPVEAAIEADLSEPQWYTHLGWKTQAALAGDAPTAIVPDGNNEISVSKNVWADEKRHWWWLQSSEVINSSLCYRNSDSPFDPGECQPFMQPPELLRYPDSSLLVYAVKMHPALSGQGGGAAIGTYVVNSCDLKDIQDKCDLYYPRFIKLRLQKPN